MPRGGKRDNAGRKAGTPNKASQKRQEEVAATGETPLEYMLKTMRDPAVPESRRDEMAKAVAPYVHPRLSAVETKDVTPRRSLSELDARIRQLTRREREAGASGTTGGAGAKASRDKAVPNVPGQGTA